MCDTNTEPKIAVSCEMKINLGNYESIGLSAVLSGLHAGATDAEIHELLETAEHTFDLVRDRLREKAFEIRQERAALKANGQR